MGTPGWSPFDEEDDNIVGGSEINPEVQQIINQINQQAQQSSAPNPADAAPQIQPQMDEPPDWHGQTMAEYLQNHPDHPVLDLIGDSAVHDALMPEPPKLHWWQDKSNPQSLSRAGKLVTVLMGMAQAGLAGRAGSEQMLAMSGGHRAGGIGVGFHYGQQAAQNLQDLLMRRQLQQELVNYRQAETAKLKGQIAALPQQQSDLSQYRQARTGYINAQTGLLNAKAANLKRAPNDKFLKSWNGDDGNVHFLFQKPNGDTYEKTSEGGFYEKPDKPRAPVILRGPTGFYQIDPMTGASRQVVHFPGQEPRRAGPEYFRRVDAWKNKAWQNVLNDNTLLTDDARTQALQHVQDHYERLIKSGGGKVAHYDVASGAIAEPWDGNPESALPADIADEGETLPAAPQSFWSSIPGAVRRH